MTNQETIAILSEMRSGYNCFDADEEPKYRALAKAIEALQQKTGHWINKTRNGQKNSECSECHTLFRVLIHDYPFCPVCGSKNGGDIDDEI